MLILIIYILILILFQQDEEAREDLRWVDVASVDPPGCTDIDDALHCRDLENGNLEVGFEDSSCLIKSRC